MAQVKEQNPAQAQNNPNRNSESGGEKRTRTRRPYYNRRPRRSQQPKEAAVPIHIYPLGGLGEVGKNMTVYECNGDMIIVDCGLVFPDSEMYGVDMVIPDFTFVVQNKDKIKGLLITHGHEDHIGSIPYLLQKFDLPIYGTRLTCGLIRNKLEEFGLAGKTKFVEITPKQKIKLGCFTVEPIHVNHSIPDSVAFAIDSPAGTIIQTGDFKIDYTPLACGVTDLTTLSEYGQKGVLALLSDSTNAERPGFTATEQKVAAGVRNLFARARNKRIIIATFASNIYRVQQIIDLAVEDGRKVAFSGRSMVNNTAMAQELGYMHIPEGTLISVDELNQYPPEQVVLITTGSQGEPLSALSRMASCSHRQVRVGPGDFIIISANPIPGNEKSVTKIVNGLLLLGAEVIYESMYDVHVSGHACQEEQKLMLTLTRPKYFLPVHGEYKQLKKHALTAASLGIPTSNILIAENGSNAMMVVTGAYAPGVITGLISAAIICATMSSADSNLLCMSTMIINDIYPGFGGKKKLDDKQTIRYTRICNVAAALIAMGISMFGVSLVAMNTFAFGIRCAGPFAAYGLGLAVPKATKNSGMISIFTGTIAFVVWQLLSNGGTLWFMMPVVFGSLVSVITFYAVNLIEWKRGVPAAPSAYAVEEAK